MTFPASFANAQRQASLLNAQTFLTSISWPVPQGVGRIKITGQAPGGGGAGSAGASYYASGSAGGAFIKWLDVQPGTTLQILIGAAGVGGSAAPGPGGDAGNLSVTIGNVTYAATGGKGASTTASVTAFGGTASGGDLNIVGGAGQLGIAGNGSGKTIGGASLFGTSSYGSGGFGSGGGPGTAGGSGIVIVEY